MSPQIITAMGVWKAYSPELPENLKEPFLAMLKELEIYSYRKGWREGELSQIKYPRGEGG